MIPVNSIQTIDVYFFSLFILILISIKVMTNPHGSTPQSRAFSVLLILTFLIILSDCTVILLDGRQGGFTRVLLVGATALGFSLQVLICFLWVAYVRMLVFTDRKVWTLASILQGLPALAGIAGAVLSCWTLWFFHFDEANVYKRGPFFLPFTAVSFIYLFYGYYLILRYKKNLSPRNFRALLSFALPPTIGGIIQTWFYGVVLLWPSMTISILIIYMAVQNELLILDDLTGTNNRRNFDFELKRRIANAKHSSPFALILIDVDNLRAINDRYGHMEGDQVLQILTKILAGVFHGNGFISRYAGDEFAVIADIMNFSDLYTIRERVWDTIEQWNATCVKPWKLSISIGCAPYIPAEKLTRDNFFVQVDKLLCLDKIVPGERRYKSREIIRSAR